ncbi:hypothetical protein M2137_000571 [Parabacteroides sp. PFB2-10]|nr:hypothetical protein [Parabacteroides sp. PFB2-10]
MFNCVFEIDIRLPLRTKKKSVYNFTAIYGQTNNKLYLYEKTNTTNKFFHIEQSSIGNVHL